MSAFSVYVAAASAPSEAARVAAAVATLRSWGIVVTSTWVDVIAKVGDANPRSASAIDRRGWATQCLNEIDVADAVLFLVPSKPITTCGGWGETLYGFSNHKHVVTAGDTKQSVFCALGHEFETDAAALRFIRELSEVPVLDLRLKDALVGGSEP